MKDSPCMMLLWISIFMECKGTIFSPKPCKKERNIWRIEWICLFLRQSMTIMAKKKQPQYQEMSLFDDSFFGNASSKGDDSVSAELQMSKNETPAVKKKSKKQLYFEELEENARRKMEEAEQTGNVLTVYIPINDDGKAKAKKVIDEKMRARGKKQRLKVAFADGTVICDVSATVTMMQVIDKIGVERVAGLRMEICHVPLVSKEVTPRYAEWTKEIKPGCGWYLMAQSDTKQKYMQLKSIFLQLGISATIEMGDFEALASDKNEGNRKVHKKKSKLCVTFTDGFVICDKDHQHVYLDTIRYVGIDKVRKANLQITGKPIIAKERKSTSQIQLSTGEWLAVPQQAKEKYKVLKVISSMTHTPFEVKIIE